MTSKDLLGDVLQTLPENRVQEVLDFARFLSLQEDREGWQEFGQRQLARAFGEDDRSMAWRTLDRNHGIRAGDVREFWALSAELTSRARNRVRRRLAELLA